MELEVKYAIPTKELADKIWDDEFIRTIKDFSSEEKVVMKAVYFDTEDYRLSDNNVTVRVRAEGERCFATLKWGGSVKGGFAEREEINVPVSGEESFIAPSAEMFAESEEGQQLLKLAGDLPLISLLETRYLRRRARLNYKNSVFELAIDTGEIVTDKGSSEILEMEIELFAGDSDELLELGEKIAKAHSLEPEEKSKFFRGLLLLRQ